MTQPNPFAAPAASTAQPAPGGGIAAIQAAFAAAAPAAPAAAPFNPFAALTPTAPNPFAAPAAATAPPPPAAQSALPFPPLNPPGERVEPPTMQAAPAAPVAADPAPVAPTPPEPAPRARRGRKPRSQNEQTALDQHALATGGPAPAYEVAEPAVHEYAQDGLSAFTTDQLVDALIAAGYTVTITKSADR